MKIITNGLVLREVKVGEADRILTLLTPKHGVISVSAKGSLRPKNKLFSSSGVFSYAEWSLFEGRNFYTADEASPIDVFFGLRESVEGISLASYIAELLQILSPTGEEAGALLKLALNAFYLLSQNKQDPAIVKMVFELRSLSESGFMPDVVACDDCGKYSGGMFYLDARSGSLLCGNCAQQQNQRPNLDEGSLAALRHIVLSDEKKVYSFTLAEDSRAMLGSVAERYVLYHIDYPPKTLTFLKTLLT